MKKFEAKMLNNCCSGLPLNDFRRVVLLSSVFSVADFATVGCSSARGGVTPGSIAPATLAPQHFGFWGSAAVTNIRQHADVF